MTTLGFAILAYLLGSIPFAVVASRLFGLADPRSYGSGNPGATNVMRSGNKPAALLTLLGDAAKGFDDHAFALEMLETEDVLIVPGSSFNVPYRNHFRVTLLPEAPMLREVFTRIDRVPSRRAASAGQRAAVA